MEAFQRAKHDVGRGPPKVSDRCSLIVHYLEGSGHESVVSGWEMTIIWARGPSSDRGDVPVHSIAPTPESHAMKTFGLVPGPPRSENKAGLMAETPNSGIPIPVRWEWYQVDEMDESRGRAQIAYRPNLLRKTPGFNGVRNLGRIGGFSRS
jgi:hypothetical protein